MRRTFLANVGMVGGLSVAGCNSSPAVDTDRATVESAEKKAAEEQAAQQRERSEEAAELERRAANLERSVSDVQADVRRLTNQKPMPEPAAKAEPAVNAVGFPERRDAFASSLRARVDAMEVRLDSANPGGGFLTCSDAVTPTMRTSV